MGGHPLYSNTNGSRPENFQKVRENRLYTITIRKAGEYAWQMSKKKKHAYAYIACYKYSVHMLHDCW